MAGTHHPDRAQWHSSIGGALAAAAALATGVAVRVPVVIAGAARVKIYFKASAAGSFDVFALKPGKTIYSTATDIYGTSMLTAAVAALANTEAVASFDCFGEHGCVLQFTPSGNGAVTYCDIARV